MTEFLLGRIERTRFRPSAEVDDTLDDLRQRLITGEKFKVARLAIGRSLAEDTAPELPRRGAEPGKTSIEGQTLFGEEVGVWACLIAEKAPLLTNLEEFRAWTEAHWTRGARLLQADLDAAGGRHADFIAELAAKAQRHGQNVETQAELGTTRFSGAVEARVGEVSTDLRTGESVRFTLNAPGVSPHIAVLGKTRSGKTRTGIVMAEQIASAAGLPMLLIDPKGEFVMQGGFTAKPEWQGRTLADRFAGMQAIDVSRQPIPLDFLYRPGRLAEVEAARSAMGFRDSFGKVLRTTGDAMLNTLRESVQSLLANGTQPVSLDAIFEEVRDANSRQGRSGNTVEAKLSEMCALRLFEPSMAPHKFFTGRWAVGLGGATEESRRLTIFLLLDALARYLLMMPDSGTDAAGYRAVRHLLIIDEAREILSYRHNALSNLVRKSAAKGGVVMLLSQSPDDFTGEEEDFLSQLGSIIVFTSSTKSVKDLRASLGSRLGPDDFSDRVLQAGIAWAKLPKRDLMKVQAWK